VRGQQARVLFARLALGGHQIDALLAFLIGLGGRVEGVELVQRGRVETHEWVARAGTPRVEADDVEPRRQTSRVVGQ